MSLDESQEIQECEDDEDYDSKSKWGTLFY